MTNVFCLYAAAYLNSFLYFPSLAITLFLCEYLENNWNVEKSKNELLLLR